MKAKARLYLTLPDANGNARLVSEGDPDANSLFVIEGGNISAADAHKYHLDENESQGASQAPEQRAAPTADDKVLSIQSIKAAGDGAENKAVKGLAENKAETPKADK